VRVEDGEVRRQYGFAYVSDVACECVADAVFQRQHVKTLDGVARLLDEESCYAGGSGDGDERELFLN